MKIFIKHTYERNQQTIYEEIEILHDKVLRKGEKTVYVSFSANYNLRKYTSKPNVFFNLTVESFLAMG